MSKYFDGYASFDWSKMSKDKLVSELKKKCEYSTELNKQLKQKDREIAILTETKIGIIKDFKEQIIQKDKEIKYLKEQPRKIIEQIINRYNLTEIERVYNNGDIPVMRAIVIDGGSLILYLRQLLKEYEGK